MFTQSKVNSTWISPPSMHRGTDNAGNYTFVTDGRVPVIKEFLCGDAMNQFLNSMDKLTTCGYLAPPTYSAGCQQFFNKCNSLSRQIAGWVNQYPNALGLALLTGIDWSIRFYQTTAPALQHREGWPTVALSSLSLLRTSPSISSRQLYRRTHSQFNILTTSGHSDFRSS